MSNTFGQRAGFDLNDSHVFPQGVLAAITLAWGVVDNGGARACLGGGEGLPLCSLAIIALSGAVSAPKLLERKPWSQARADSFLFN